MKYDFVTCGKFYQLSLKEVLCAIILLQEAENQMVPVVKKLRTAHDMGLLEARMLCDYIREHGRLTEDGVPQFPKTTAGFLGIVHDVISSKSIDDKAVEQPSMSLGDLLKAKLEGK